MSHCYSVALQIADAAANEAVEQRLEELKAEYGMDREEEAGVRSDVRAAAIGELRERAKGTASVVHVHLKER